MKKTIIIFCLALFTMPCFSYTWIPFCPDTIHAENICFGIGSWKGTICSPEGMYLWEDDLMEWSFYTYGLPVTGAASLDPENILVAMGDGTYSDGVYSFNLQTHEFEVIEWLINPNFLIQNFNNGKYYIGSQFGGLWESEDGLIWTSVPYFDGKSCTAMVYYENHMVVTEVSNIHNIYISDDSGNSWLEAAAGTPMITDLKFSLEGDLYGAFPDFSNSSGLYTSDDWGNSWEVEFWSDNMSAVGFDAMGTVFVGWAQPPAGNEGIAIYTPGTVPPNLSFLNEGLPNLNINKILMNPFMSAIAIFCCTDAGVFVCYDYMVGVHEVKVKEASIQLYPNPARKSDQIWIESQTIIKEVKVYTLNGGCLSSLNWNQNSHQCNLDMMELNLTSGTYLIQVKTNESEFIEKLIIH